jgi:uncharacterized phiE125 gp8 family phage protein
LFGLTVTVAPTEEPISRVEAKANARIAHNDEDVLFDALIVAAREYVETHLGRALVSRTIRMTLDRFPAGCIYLPRPPLVSVTSVAYTTATGTTTTLVNNTDYRYDAASEPGRIEPITTWPTADDRLAAVQIVYVAGYGAATAVPKKVKQAMLMLVTHWYENRVAVGESGSEVPMAAKALLGSSWSGTMAGSYAELT